MEKRTVYYSRVDAWLVILVTVAFVAPIAADATNVAAWIMCLLPLATVLAAIFSIRYVIQGTQLKVYVLFWHSTIDITTITRIEPSHSLLSSPAASLNRIAIHHSNHHSNHQVVYLSPRHQAKFIAQLEEIANGAPHA